MSRTELIRVTADPKPSIWSRMVEVVRSYTVGPLTSRSPELAKYFGGSGPSMAGVSVTEHSALAYSPVWAAVRLVSDDISALPLMLYKRLPNGGKDRFEEHPLYRILHDEPNPEMGTMFFRQTLQAHLMLWGNAYAEIERDKVGRPIALWPLVPESVRVARDRTRALVYVVNNPEGGEVTIPAADMIHLRKYSHDGVVGCSVIDKAREAIALGLAAEQFGATFFGNGATFGGVISFKGPKPPEMSEDNYRASLEARHQGVKRAHKLLALYNDASFTPTGVEPNSAQFLETRVHQIREAARFWKIPPTMLGDLGDATFSNVQDLRQFYYTSAILPDTKIWEEELSRKLIARLERRQQFIEHDIKGFLQADPAGRGTFYSAMFRLGCLTRNEIRGFENLDPVEGGDETYLEGNNYVPARLLTAKVEAEIEASKAKAAAPIGGGVPAVPDPSVNELKTFIADLESRLQQTMTEETGKRAAAEAEAAAAGARLEARNADVASLQADRDAQAAQAEALRGQVAEMQAAHAERVTVLEARSGELQQAIAAAEADLHATRSRQVDTQVERDTQAALVAEREAALATLRAEQADVTARAAAQIAELEQQWHAERATLQAEQAAAQAAKNDLDVMLGAADQARDAASKALTEAVEREAVLAEQVDNLKAERNALMGAEAERAAVEVELRAQIAAQQAQADSLTRAALEAEAAKALAEARAADRDAAAVSALAERAVMETRQASTVDRLGAIALAHRALFVDAFARLLQREADRARKAQATPEKLRAWVDTFYPLHEETCRSVLRPVMLAWAPCVGMSAETLLADVVREHLDTSRRELRLAADTEDADELAANLARVLHRWETERADAMADRLLAEGERHGH